VWNKKGFVERFLFWNDKERFLFKRIIPIYEEKIGNTNICFFKIKHDKKIYMSKNKLSIYFAKKLYLKIN